MADDEGVEEHTCAIKPNRPMRNIMKSHNARVGTTG